MAESTPGPDEDAVEAAYARLEAEEKKAMLDTELALKTLFHTTLAEIAKGSIDRAREGAKFVQTAATAIFTVYTGLLALVFSVTDHPLPLRGAYAGVFLGLSIAFGTVYLIYLGRDRAGPPYKPDLRSEDQMQMSRTAYLTTWVNDAVGSKRYATRASALALLFGVLFIAAPFVSSATPTEKPAIVTAPTPPPAGLGKDVDALALRVYAAQVEDYEKALAARAAGLAVEKQAAADRRTQEHRLDRVFGWLAGIALVVVLLGPFVPEAWPPVWHFFRGPQPEDNRKKPTTKTAGQDRP